MELMKYTENCAIDWVIWVAVNYLRKRTLPSLIQGSDSSAIYGIRWLMQCKCYSIYFYNLLPSIARLSRKAVMRHLCYFCTYIN